MARRSLATPTLLPVDELRVIAQSALVAVAQDPLAPPAARAAASRTLLESLGDIGRLQEQTRRADKPLTELNLNEINTEIERLSAKLGPRDKGDEDGEEAT
jgi:hypothetical protein